MRASGSSLLAQTFSWNRPDWASVAVFGAVINLMMLAPTLYMLQIYDRVMISGSGWTLLAVTLITLFLLAVMAIADWFRSRLLIRIGLSIDARLAPAVFQASCRQRLQGRAGSASQSLGDLTQVRQFLTGSGLLALLDIPWIPIYIGVLFLLHPVLGLTACAFGVLQLVLTVLSHRGSQQQVDASQQALQTADVINGQFLRVADAVNAMGMASRVRGVWQQRHASALNAEEALARQQARWTACSKWLRYTQQSAALGIGAWLAIRGEVTAGAMIAGNVLTARALAPIDTWAQTWGAALGASKALGRLQALLGAPHVSHLGAAAQASVPLGDAVVRLDGLTIAFPNRPHPALDNIDLVLAPGQLTLVQGPSASGKTTLARAVLGIAGPTSGRVHWQLRRRSASDAIGYLPQSVDLFDGTVAENIARFAEPDTQKVIEAARLVGLHEIIQHMPLGYDTLIGAGGQFLSGGQRQRVALARAVYGQPDLLVLDEPNAQLDVNGEMALQTALGQMKRRGCAVLVISHRPGLQALADVVITLGKGRIVDRAMPSPVPIMQSLAA